MLFLTQIISYKWVFYFHLFVAIVYTCCTSHLHAIWRLWNLKIQFKQFITVIPILLPKIAFFSAGYVLIDYIPRGSTNVRIVEKTPSRNYLGKV